MSTTVVCKKLSGAFDPLCMCSNPPMIRPMYTLIHMHMPMHIFRLCLDLLTTMRWSDRQKDFEILLLRQQIRIMQRKSPRSPHISAWEKSILAILAVRFRELSTRVGGRLEEVMLLFKTDTVLRWHRELVRHKWTFQRDRPAGRPPIATELEELIVRLATENPRWGYSKIQGELMKLGHTISRSSVRNVLKRGHTPPSPQRMKQGSSWRTFLGHYAHQIIACDFFTVETTRLQTLYALFFIELGIRRVHFAGCTAHPTSAWVPQQARNIAWDIQEFENKEPSIRCLIHDRDTKFTLSFNTVFVSESIEIIRTPYRAPKANAFAERWVQSAREECLDHLLIISESHLRRVLAEYVLYYNSARPHQGIGQRIPMPNLVSEKRVDIGDGVHHRDVLRGIIHDYYRSESKAA